MWGMWCGSFARGRGCEGAWHLSNETELTPSQTRSAWVASWSLGYSDSDCRKPDFQGTLAQMSQTIGTSGNELVELRGLRLLFRFELLTNLLRNAPKRIVFSQLLQRIVFRWIGEGFSFEHVRAAIKR